MSRTGIDFKNLKPEDLKKLADGAKSGSKSTAAQAYRRGKGGLRGHQQGILGYCETACSVGPHRPNHALLV
jgi:hypothetical protein